MFRSVQCVAGYLRKQDVQPRVKLTAFAKLLALVALKTESSVPVPIRLLILKLEDDLFLCVVFLEAM
jgi:hypothetical protein